MSLPNSQPSGAWTFDSGVVSVFDAMVRASVPLYEQTVALAHQFYRRYHQPGLVADLGCATGYLASVFDAEVLCVDSSTEMLEVCKQRNPKSRCVCSDLRLGLPPECQDARYFTMLWTAQFVPMEYRQQLFSQIHQVCKRNGGALFLAEKIRGQTATFQTRLVELYHDWKAANGYTVEQIAAKARSLENRLVSFDAPGLKATLTAEGWKVEEVIRYLSFAAWYCVP